MSTSTATLTTINTETKKPVRPVGGFFGFEEEFDTEYNPTENSLTEKFAGSLSFLENTLSVFGVIGEEAGGAFMDLGRQIRQEYKTLEKEEAAAKNGSAKPDKKQEDLAQITHNNRFLAEIDALIDRIDEKLKIENAIKNIGKPEITSEDLAKIHLNASLDTKNVNDPYHLSLIRAAMIEEKTMAEKMETQQSISETTKGKIGADIEAMGEGGSGRGFVNTSATGGGQ